jgi:hypothetical protein
MSPRTPVTPLARPPASTTTPNARSIHFSQNKRVSVSSLLSGFPAAFSPSLTPDIAAPLFKQCVLPRTLFPSIFRHQLRQHRAWTSINSARQGILLPPPHHWPISPICITMSSSSCVVEVILLVDITAWPDTTS